MSNHPPPPAYAIPLNGQSSVSSSNQYSGQGRESASARQPTSFAAFQHNGTLPVIDPQHLAAHGPDFAALWNHITNGSIAPPPIPPPPFQQPPSLPHTHQPSLPGLPPAMLQNHTNQLQLQPHHHQTHIPQLDGSQDRRVAGLVSEKEEGELSDTEGSTYSQSIPQLRYPISVDQVPNQAGRTEETQGGGNISEVDTMGRRYGSYQSYRPSYGPPTTLPGLTAYEDSHNMRGLASIHSRPMSPQYQNQNTSTPPTQKRPLAADIDVSGLGRAPHPNGHKGADPLLYDLSRKQEVAKAFIRTLSQNDYGLSDLVEEGVDSNALKTLFEELGISTGYQPLKEKEFHLSRASHQHQHVQSEHETLPGLSYDSDSTRDQPLPDSIPNIARQSAQPVSKTPAVAPPAKTTKPVEVEPLRKQTLPVDQTAGKSTNPDAKRQEYLARLMAAKKKKPTAAGGVSPAETTSPTPKQAEIQPNQSTTLPQAPPKEEVVVAPGESDETAQKRKAQTELARKRMEALQSMRNKSSLQSKGHGIPTEAAQPIQLEAPLDLITETASPAAVGASVFPQTSQPPSAVTSSLFSPTPGSASTLPGLFTEYQTTVSNVSLNQKVPQPDTHTTPSATTRQKRPSDDSTDSDGQSLYQSTPAKRRFGEPRRSPVHHERFIIEISDDESGDSVMDLDEPNAEPTRSVPFFQAFKATTTPVQPQSNKVPPLSRTISSTQPSVQTGGNYVDIQDRIAALKQEIAEKEARKLARQQDSGHQTPIGQQLSTTSSPKPEVQLGTAQKTPGHNVPPQSTVTANAASSKSAILPAIHQVSRLAQTASPSPGGHRDAIERRRAEIDASVASNRARLEQLKREMELLEADNLKKLEEQKELTSEPEDLSVDAKDSSDEQLQAKRNEVIQQRQEQISSEGSLSTRQSSTFPVDVPPSMVPVTLQSQPKVTSTQRDDAVHSSHEDEQISPVSGPDDAMDMSESESDEGEILYGRSDPNPQQSQFVLNPAQEPVVVSSDSDETSDSVPSAPGDTYVNENRAHDQPSAHAKSPTPEDTEGSSPDFYGNGEPDTSHDVDSSSESSGMEMQQLLEQDSGEEEDYQPDVDEDVAMETSSASESDGELEENYTPPEPADSPVLEPPNADTSSSKSSEPSVAQEPSPNQPDANVTNSVEIEMPEPVTRPTPIPQAPTEVFENRSQPRLLLVPDYSSTFGLNPLGSQPDYKHLSNDVGSPNHFAPYESALRIFKAFRFHPKYQEQVDGGFRSLTYSHLIDPNLPLCPFEAAGGTCNDPQCINQHFREMRLSDDMMLVQLGSMNPGTTTDEKERWNQGLKAVLQGLRAISVTDVDFVADAISKFHREYMEQTFNDPTRLVSF